VGQNIANTRVLHIDHLGQVIEIFGVEIGVITANVWAAQSLCDEMVRHGVKAIWNFAPIHLIAPEPVLVRSEDFAGSLAVISHHLRHFGRRSEEE
jgi:redox-sensing transcriptional repressor